MNSKYWFTNRQEAKMNNKGKHYSNGNQKSQKRHHDIEMEEDKGVKKFRHNGEGGEGVKNAKGKQQSNATSLKNSKIPKLKKSAHQNNTHNNKNYNNNGREKSSSSKTAIVEEAPEKTDNNNTKESIKDQRKRLPIAHCKQQILDALQAEQTLVLMGETGCGKTTQIPQYLLAAGYCKDDKMIAITQPRRVAAITVAKRVAVEQNCNVGDLVGYTVRFEDCTTNATRIRFMTDGYLLREAIRDPLLKRYSVIMLDEAHERTVSTDVLIGLLKKAQKQRNKLNSLQPLKLIIASASMNIDQFSKYFGVKGVYVMGRTYMVRTMHITKPIDDYQHAALVTFFEIHRNQPINYDVLIFLTGQEEIETMSQKMKKIVKCNSDIMHPIRVFPLYAQLPQHRQLECFLPTRPGVRKVVLATNVAETSITIPGIRCVIDTGYVKRRIYNPVTGLEVLRVVPISLAQAWQRSGRAGRNSTGVCYRMYTKDQMKKFEKMEQPEILRSNISTAVLQLLLLSIDFRDFDFIDKPSVDSVSDAYVKLYYLGAIMKFKFDKIPELTPLGRQMAVFPLEPRYSKLILSAPKFGCLEEIVNLVSILSSQEVFVRSIDKAEQAQLAHAKFYSKYGDHLTLLNVFNTFLERDNIKLWCQDNFLNARNLMYAKEVRQQLLDILSALKLKMSSCGENLDQVRKCMISGLFDNIAELRHDRGYLTITGKLRAKIHPSSILHGRYQPQYLIYSEIVLTERNYLRYVTEIQPEWVGEVMPNFMYLNRIKVNERGA